MFSKLNRNKISVEGTGEQWTKISQNHCVEKFKEAADYILARCKDKPEVGLVLGSCLGPVADIIEDPIEIDYAQIPNFLISTVKSHAGKMIIGKLGGKTVVCMSGRFHYYEGYDFEQLAGPIRVMKLLGITDLILTNASGAINTDYKPGDIMVIKDHIKLMGASPLRGENIDEFGERFFDTSNMYTEELRKLALMRAEKSSLTFHEGVYFYSGGPQFETPAEIRAMRILGADAVGMSTVTEAITACHMGLPVLGLAVITNMASGIAKHDPVSDVDNTAELIANDLTSYIVDVIRCL